MPRTALVKQSLNVVAKVELKPVVVTRPALEAKIETRMQTAAKISQLEAKKKELDGEILPQVEKLGKDARAIDIGDYQCFATDSHSSSLDRDILKQLMLDAGLKATKVAAILEGANKKVPYTYVRYARKKVSLGEKKR